MNDQEENIMANYANIFVSEEYITVSFDAGNDDIMAIGEKMNEMYDEAYMNGYNWDAFMNCYLEQNAPEILEVIDSDPEADMYSVYFEDVSDENKELAEKLVQIIDDLLSSEARVISFLESNADVIEWD